MITTRRAFAGAICARNNSFSNKRTIKYPLTHLRCKHNHSEKLSSKWKGVVGLEIHAQLNTISKLFSGASTSFGSFINDNVSLFDAAAPGTLPVLNKKAVEMGLITALALSCTVNSVSFFDRKHYFYADLPAGYQITQQRCPLAVNGFVEFQVFAPSKKKSYTKKSKLKQIQLEQDSGKSLHDEQLNRSLIDLNRAGNPLLELVFEPDLTDGDEAASLVKELCLILTKLKTCSCRMEEGALRVDANISVHREDQPLGVRTEVKNLGSIRGVANAVDFEIQRQINELSSGRLIENETRSWDVIASRTVPMRDKEVKLDYRFMPEPNLPPLRVNTSSDPNDSLIHVPSLRSSLPVLPSEMRRRLMDDYGLSADLTNNLVNEDILLGLFTDVITSKKNRDAKTVAKILTIELMTLVNDNFTVLEYPRWNPSVIGEIVDLLEGEEINLGSAQLLLLQIAKGVPGSPKELTNKLGLAQISDQHAIEKLCREVIESNPQMEALYRGGKKKVFNAFLGLIGKKSGNRANMKLASQVLKKMLSS